MISFAVGNASRLPLKDGIVQCVMTSPPYWGLRDYKTAPLVWGGDAGCKHAWGPENEPKRRRSAIEIAHSPKQQTEPASVMSEGGGNFCQCGAWRGSLGLEPIPDLYIHHLVEIFREVRRVLRDDGTVWLNLGDSYATKPAGNKMFKHGAIFDGRDMSEHQEGSRKKKEFGENIKEKDLIGIPWRVAFALQADGWYLRSDIIWAKGYSFHPTTAGSCMPESVRDRPTRGHEYLFLLSKNAKYYYDAEAVKENGIFPAGTRAAKGSGTREGNRRGGMRKKDLSGVRGPASERTQSGDFQDRWDDGYATYSGKRNLRSVWLINPKPYREAHFATFPPALVEPCIKAGSSEGSLVLDPFCGSGTVGLVCQQLNRDFFGMDYQSAYLELVKKRLRGVESARCGAGGGI